MGGECVRERACVSVCVTACVRASLLGCVVSVCPPDESRCRRGPVQQQALLSWTGLLVGGKLNDKTDQDVLQKGLSSVHSQILTD